MKTTVRSSKFALQISCMLNIYLNFTRQTFAPYGTLRTWILSIHCRVMTFGGLALIALGTGGIKPCVAAFGGDQFQDHQVRASWITYHLHKINYACFCIPTFRSIFSPSSFPSSTSLSMLAV